jgi:uncharacterized membrane protein
MEGIYVLAALFFFFAFPVLIILVIVLFTRVGKLRDRIGILEVRLESLETPAAPRREVAPSPAPGPMPAQPPMAAAPPPPAPAAAPAAPPPAPPAAAPAPQPEPVLVAASARVTTPVEAPVPTPAPPAPARGAFEASKLEQLIGGIWLQNVGSVLLLLGSFFLILWGYTQGKIGPEILVAASVALGVFLAWRGDRIARTIRPLGSALLGVGLGIVYISLYLGHFRMHVLSEPIAFILLALVSFATVDIGLRRLQPVIAAFGVIGAFFPLVIPAALGFAFTLPPHSKLAYLLAVNAVVFTLTAIRGWSGLVLLSLAMTSMAWATNQAAWDLPIQIELSLLFTALGIAPVIRLARMPDPIRRVDLAVVVAAPILLFVVSLPFFEKSSAPVTGGIFAALGALNLAAAVWVDARRTERDLWRPLTAIGTMFLTAALERFLAKENLALAWAVEGAVLIWLGLAPRGRWFRGLGYAVSILAAGRLLLFAGSYDPSLGGGVGVFNGFAIRDLLCIVTFIVISDRLAHHRSKLGETEASAVNLWLFGVNLLLMQWIVREAPHYTRLLLGSWGPGPITAPETPGWAMHRKALGIALAWTIQFAALELLGFRRRSRIQRMVGYGVGTAAFIIYVIAVAAEPRLTAVPGRSPFDPVAVTLAFCVAVFLVTARYIERRRAELESGESWTPALATLSANAALMFWTGLESDRIARVVGIGSPPTYALWASATLAQAGLLLLLSRWWDSRLQRHVAYVVGTIGLATQLSATAIEISARPLADPFFDTTGLVLLVSVLLLFSATIFLARGRSGLGSAERRSPEIATVAANVALMLWSAMEAGRLANTIAPGTSFTSTAYDSTAMLGAVLTSACWVIQAGSLLALGWSRRSPFLRWVGLCLVGITIVKFVVADLQRVDIFWRFVIALGVGAVLLVVSFVYQRMARRQVET